MSLGSIILSDQWPSYNDIIRLNFNRFTVNHSLNFFGPEKIIINGCEEKLHSNWIEIDWNACKQRFKYMGGCNRSYLQAYNLKIILKLDNSRERIVSNKYLVV